MPFAGMYNFTPSFPICIPLVSFSYLMALAKTSRTILNSNGESGQPCLAAYLTDNGSRFFPILYDARCTNCFDFVEVWSF